MIALQTSACVVLVQRHEVSGEAMEGQPLVPRFQQIRQQRGAVACLCVVGGVKRATSTTGADTTGGTSGGAGVAWGTSPLKKGMDDDCAATMRLKRNAGTAPNRITNLAG